MFDILICNGIILDGTGNPGRHGDIAIINEKIVEIGSLKNKKAKIIIDATGKYVCPGFIDAHSHSDVTIGVNQFCESTIRQGITTEIVGNCGNSIAPFCKKGGSVGGFGKFSDEEPLWGYTLGQYMEHIDKRGMSGNLAWLVGHNTIRSVAGVKNSDVTEEYYKKMESVLEQALDDGAMGLSSGLEFEPGRTCRPEELMRLAKLLQKYDAIYTSHIRNRDEKVLSAVDEFLDVIRQYGIRGEISHMNIRHNTHAPENAVQKCIEKIQDARNYGFDVLTDMTPLNFGIGQMAGILPPWFTAEPPEKLQELLLNKKIREKLRVDCDRYWRFINNGEWERVRMQSNKPFPEINGMTFPEIANLWKKDPWDCYFDILAASAPDIDSAVLVSYLFTDAHLIETISNPLYMLVVDGYSTSVDGILAKHTQFPLHYIGMAWFLTHHVREKHTLSLEEAVRKMTSMPATHFKLEKRGLLMENYFADICIFDFNKLYTPFDLQKPAQYTQGMDYVIVNGFVVLDKGQHTKALAGKNLRK